MEFTLRLLFRRRRVTNVKERQPLCTHGFGVVRRRAHGRPQWPRDIEGRPTMAKKSKKDKKKDKKNKKK